MQTPRLIVMLTHNDVTSKDSMQIFDGAKDAPAEYWGFKDVGLAEPEMLKLVQAMHAAGKKVFLETLSYSEADTMKAAQLALRCGFDFLLGGSYYRGVADYTEQNGIKFSPFVGHRHNGNLYGDVDELIEQVRQRNTKNVYGLNVSAFRYDGDAHELVRRLVLVAEKPLSLVGGVNDYKRLEAVRDSGCWAFTIGGAFFENKFGEGFANQIEAVQNFLHRQ